MLKLAMRGLQNPQELFRTNVFRWFVQKTYGQSPNGDPIFQGQVFVVVFDKPFVPLYGTVECSKPGVHFEQFELSERMAMIGVADELDGQTVEIRFGATRDADDGKPLFTYELRRDGDVWHLVIANEGADATFAADLDLTDLPHGWQPRPAGTVSATWGANNEARPQETIRNGARKSLPICLIEGHGGQFTTFLWYFDQGRFQLTGSPPWRAAPGGAMSGAPKLHFPLLIRSSAEPGRSYRMVLECDGFDLRVIASEVPLRRSLLGTGAGIQP
jgi:hypothetical protein